ncbi:MAG: SMR family transporter [Acetivibrionales bacterium]|jgi:multidrug transporter EmrE-like cation transporter
MLINSKIVFEGGKQFMKAYVMVILSILTSALGQVTLKWGTLSVDKSPSDSIFRTMLKYFTNIHIICGIALYGLSMTIWILAISKIQLSVAYPMVAFGYIIVTALSYFMFHEPLSKMKVAGLATIVLGVIMIARS